MTRVSIDFPFRDNQEIKAFSFFMDYLLSFRLGKETKPTDITGFSYNAEMQRGYFWSTDDEAWIPDQIRQLFIDFDLEEDDHRLTQIIEHLKEKFFEFYLK